MEWDFRTLTSMNNKPLAGVAQKTGLGPDSDQARWAIREIKAFLYSYRKWVHSLVMFGSYALWQAGRHSDVDFLVLLKKGEQVRKIKRILFYFKLNDRSNRESNEIWGRATLIVCKFGGKAPRIAVFWS